MIAVSVSFPDAKRIGGLGAGSEGLFRKTMMLRLGQFARDTVVARVRSGIGSDDAPMPPLKGRYLQFKSRHGKNATFTNIGYSGWKSEHGLQPKRDMWGTGKEGGHMLDNFTVRPATLTVSSVRIAITQNMQRAKAISNEKRTPFLSFSDSDIAKIMDRASAMFKAEINASTSDWPALIRRAKNKN